MVAPETRLSVPDHVLFRDLGGEAVLLNTRSGQYYGLDETGTRMWHLLSGGAAVAAVCDTMVEEYDVEAGKLRRDVLKLRDDLLQMGLLAEERS